MTEPFLTPGVTFDYDQAACALAGALGVYAPPGSTFGPAKWVFNTVNPVGDAITALLDRLVEAGVLDAPEPGAYRWREGYDPAKFGDHCPVRSES